MNLFHWHSLKMRVTLFTLAIFVVGIWSLAFYSGRMLREDMERALGDQQLTTVSNLAIELDQDLGDRLRALEKVAGIISPGILGDTASLQALLNQRLILQGPFNAGVFVTRLDGVAVAELPAKAGRVGVNYIDRDALAAALKAGKSSIGRVVIGRPSQTPVIGMAVPVRDGQGAVIGAIAGVTDLSIPNFLDHFTRNRYGKTGYFLLVDAHHRLVITDTDKRRIMQPLPAPGISRLIDRHIQGFEETGVAFNPAGVEVLASAKRIPLTDWRMVAALPTHEAFAPIRAMQKRMLLATIFLTLLAAGLTWWMLRRQLSPIFTAANALASLDQRTQPLPVTSRDEIGELIGGFNRLLEVLGQREQALSMSEQKLSVVLESVDACIYLKDTQGRYLFANRAVCEVFGVSMNEIIGQTDVRFFDAATAARLHRSDLQILENGETLKGEEANVNLKNGRTTTYWSVKLPLRNADGEIYALCGISTDITERKQLEEAQKKTLDLLEKIASRVPGVVYQFRLRPDGSSCFPFASDIIREIYRVSPEEVREDASAVFAVLHPDDREGVIASIRESARNLSPWSHEYRVLFDDDTVRWLSGNALPEHEADGSTLWHGFITDVTARKTSEEKLHLAANVFLHSREGIMITEPSGTILDVNDAFTRITGYGRDEVVGRNPRILNSGRQGREFYTTMWNGLLEKGHWYGEVWNRRKDGEVFAEMQTISTVRDAHGIPQCYVALFSDITSQKAHQSQLEHIAHYDALTALPNRVLLADRLHQAMTQAQRRSQLLAVVYLDLDGFKAINDHHGHDIGDQLLVVLASRMKQALREGDTLARLGGDEFVAALLDLEDTSASAPMLTRLLAAAAEPVDIDGLTLQVSASLGVTFYPQLNDIDADQLLRQADQAMYQAKLAGKNRYHVFDAEQDSSIRGYHESLERIRHALDAHEFVLYYQPKVDMVAGTVIGAEALIRWQHPERGLLSPMVFLPVIEEHPLAVDVGEWVIDAALTQVVLWRAAGLELPVSVNVGARQLQQPGFVEWLKYILAAHPDTRPGDLQIEVLETSALEDLTQVTQVVEACREIGVSFALDDFGTGYSSLTYLKHLPVTLLKIDQSFVRDMLDDPDDLAILQGVLGLATAFNREAIAEGVETVEHGEMLLQLGCQLAQGYGIARPMPAHEMPHWAATWRIPPSWEGLPMMDRDDLPLLHVCVEHRAWVAILENYLKGERVTPPPMDHRQSRFGQWLETDGAARYGARQTFLAVLPLNRQVHALAAELLELHIHGRNPDALARLDELHGLRDAVLEKLKALVCDVRQ